MAKHRESSPRPKRRAVKRHRASSGGNGCLVLLGASLAGVVAAVEAVRSFVS